MKTAVFVSFYESYPPVFGAAVVTYNIARQFPGKKNILQLSKNTRDKFTIMDLNIYNFSLKSTHPFVKFVKVFFHLPRIVKTIKKIKPDLVFFEGASWTVYYLLLFYALKISGIETRIIYHAHNVEYLLRKEKNGKIISSMTRMAEKRLMQKADVGTAVSGNDKYFFSQLYDVEPEILPNGVDIERFQFLDTATVGAIRKKYLLEGKVVLFMGLPQYVPNREGIEFLVKKVFPALRERGYAIKLAIIGGELKNKSDYIVNPGVIPFEEVPCFIKACDICVAPIFSGSGTRLKILEYMAAERPVVSTTKGAEGLFYEHEENILIADDSDGFVEAISFLFDNPEIAERIAFEGKKMVSEHYSWKTIIDRFLNRIECVM